MAMEQMTLWVPEQAADLATNPIWEELNPRVKRDTVIKLSLLMVKAVNPNQNDVENTQENNHDQ